MCPACSASCSCPRVTSSHVGPPTGGCSETCARGPHGNALAGRLLASGLTSVGRPVAVGLPHPLCGADASADGPPDADPDQDEDEEAPAAARHLEGRRTPAPATGRRL